MAPTHRRGNEEIEGRYKEYVYSPVAASASSAVCESTTLGKQQPATAVSAKRPANCERPAKRPTLRHEPPRPAATDMAEKGSTLPQYIAAAAANLATVAGGGMLGWTSPIFPKLALPDNPLGRPITDEEKSWIGSLVAIGAAVGSFAAGIIAEKFGRKLSLLFSAAPLLLGWILVATAGHVAQLYVARLIFGFSLAFAFAIVPMYCGEIAETSVRGALGSFLQLFITFGLLFAYSVGPYVSYHVFWIALAALPIIFVVCFMFMPESPYFLLKQGKTEDALNALARLRGKTPSSVQKEADEMQAAVEESFRNKASISDLFTVKANLKGMLLTSALAGFQQLTGINFVLFYMEDIFKAAKSTLDSSVSTIIVASVQMVASAITPIVVDRLGRKMLLIFSAVGETVTLGALGLYFYLQDTLKQNTDHISMLPVLSLVIFISTYSVGWGPLPWTVMGEMLAPNVKSIASSIAVCVCWGLAFFITRFANDLKSRFGNHTLFWMFAAFSLGSLVFTVLLVPETKGKSLQEIQDELSGVKRSPSARFESGEAEVAS